jgi:acid stress-induced BolA-like protein IbaG/YrbA
MTLTTEQIKEMIQNHLPNAEVRIEDPQNDGVHLRAVIISEDFEGQSRLQRHRTVYAALGDVFQGPLHALQMITKTPKEVE